MIQSSTKLYDNHGRPINYLRLAVTDRCNLRCFYCMPEEGINYVPRQELLTLEEMERLVRVLVNMGITKVRITGGEPFLRRGMEGFLVKLQAIDGLEALNLTTNGTMPTLLEKIMQRVDFQSINLSIDTLNRERFHEITRRDELPNVLKTLDFLLAQNITTKINVVVMDGRNIEDLISMVEMTRDMPIGVRFIEEMPFNGSGAHPVDWQWNYKHILEHIRAHFPEMEKIKDAPNSTSINYKIKNFQGTIGLIPAYSRTFCGSCNRIRLTPQGMLRTCLYDEGVFNVRDLMRAGATDNQLKDAFLAAFGNRAKDGFEAEKLRIAGVSESMASIGG